MSVHFSSQTDLWATPQEFFDRLNSEFNFQTDVCANDENAKCEKYFTAQDDGLSKQWQGSCWMNPPYGRHIGAWMKKAFEESKSGSTVVCLVPARTDTKWFHNIACKGKILLLKGRVKFIDPENSDKNSPPFPSMLVVYDKKIKPSIITWDWKSHV